MTASDIFARLRAAGVDRVEIIYDGSSDEGGVEDVAYYAADDTDPRFVDREVEEALTRRVLDHITEHWPGWEINDGSTGEVTVHVGTQLIRIEHRIRLIDYADALYEGEL